MRIISRPTLEQFWMNHPRAEQPLRSWHDEARQAIWNTPQDIKNHYASASFVGGNRVVFNIKGNDYRLVTAIAYQYEAVYIKFVGTHEEYDQIDVTTVEHKP